MIQLCLLFFAIMLLSAAVSYWLANTTLPANALRYIYAVVVAVVLISILFDVSVVFGFPSWIFIISALLVGLGCFYYQWRKQGYFVPGLAYSSINIYSVPLMALLCGLSYIFTACSSRWGRWDAKAIWTLHALFLTYGHSWRNMFTDTIAWSHPDYPLLLSSLVAMCWKSMSIVNPLVPCVIAYLVFILVLLTVYFGLRERDRYFIGLVGLVPFIFLAPYIRMAASQGADTLLSLFMLLSFVLARQNDKKHDTKIMLLAGFITGFAGWIKNEGIAFIVIFSVGIIWKYRKERYALIPYMYGIALPLLIIILFKLLYAPANDIIAGQDHGALLRLTDMSRYRLASIFFLDHIYHLYPAVLLLLAFAIARSYRLLFYWQLAAIVAMLGVYFFTFICTPRNLYWHLDTASERLFLQLFPALIYVLLSILANEPDQKGITG